MQERNCRRILVDIVVMIDSRQNLSFNFIPVPVLEMIRSYNDYDYHYYYDHLPQQQERSHRAGAANDPYQNIE